MTQDEQFRGLRRVGSCEPGQPPEHLDYRQIQHPHHHDEIMAGYRQITSSHSVRRVLARHRADTSTAGPPTPGASAAASTASPGTPATDRGATARANIANTSRSCGAYRGRVTCRRTTIN